MTKGQGWTTYQERGRPRPDNEASGKSFTGGFLNGDCVSAAAFYRDTHGKSL